MKFQDILNEQRFQYVVDGYGYNEEEDFPIDADEPSKKWHYMTTPTGERITLDHSPYQWMDKDEFAVYVAKHKAGLRESKTKDEFIAKIDDSFKKKLRAAFFEGKYYDDDQLRDPDQSPIEYFEEWYERKIT